MYYVQCQDKTGLKTKNFISGYVFLLLELRAGSMKRSKQEDLVDNLPYFMLLLSFLVFFHKCHFPSSKD